jgi:hypothetical protein
MAKAPRSQEGLRTNLLYGCSRSAVIQLTGRIGCSAPKLSRDLAREQVRDGGEPDVQVRANVQPLPAENAGPIWSKKIKGPTVHRRADGSKLRISKWPMLRALASTGLGRKHY